MKINDETNVDCENCDYRDVSYYESDTGYEEWSCELLEKYLQSMKDGRGVSCPAMYGEEDSVCPLLVKYTVEKES